MFEILFVGLAVRYGRQQQVPPGQRVTDREVQQHNLQVGVGAQALKKDTAVVDFARIPAVPSAARDVVEGEIGGAGYSAAGGSARMGRLGGFEAAVVFVDEAEDERRVERPVETEEDGVGYEAVEGDACGGDAGCRARSAGEATRTRISARRSSGRAAGCRGDSVASRRGRIGQTGDDIASAPPASGGGRN